MPGKEIIPTADTWLQPGQPLWRLQRCTNFRSPYNVNFNLQIEKSSGSQSLCADRLCWQPGSKLLSLLNINQPHLGGAPGPFSGDYGGYYYSDINQIQSIGTSNYNSLQATFRTTNWHGLTSQAGLYLGP